MSIVTSMPRVSVAFFSACGLSDEGIPAQRLAMTTNALPAQSRKKVLGGESSAAITVAHAQQTSSSAAARRAVVPAAEKASFIVDDGL